MVNWGYNAWGEKYPPYDLDNAIPERIATARALPCFTPDMILEGGSIEVNGQGTLITTESCLLNPNRNPALDRAAIEQQLRDYLGVRNILWLGDGIVGDDTDGHVDDLTRFVDTQTVVTAVEPDPQDPNHVSLQANLERLQAMRTEDGSPLRVIELPMPEPARLQGERMPRVTASRMPNTNFCSVPLCRRKAHRPVTSTTIMVTCRGLWSFFFAGADSAASLMISP